jgi:hypothetical protein
MQDLAVQEAMLLEARSLPLRAYLLEHVVPSVTYGLLEIAKVKPQDPVDYLVSVAVASLIVQVRHAFLLVSSTCRWLAPSLLRRPSTCSRRRRRRGSNSSVWVVGASSVKEMVFKNATAMSIGAAPVAVCMLRQ